jgi:hypothetical protein
MTSIIAVLAILIVVGIAIRHFELQNDTEFLRHTVTVNLSILEPELVELTAVALAKSAAPPSPDGVSPEALAEAKQLLAGSDAAAKLIRSRVDQAKLKELGHLLTLVFQAMSQATDARIMLKACAPISESRFEG